MARGRNRNKPDATGRNEQVERFARLPHRILLSEAYRSLDPVARALLTELVMIDNGKNNGSLWLSIADATDRLGLADQRPAMRAFDDLQDRGVLVMTKDAHFSVKAGETSRARCWRITWLPFDGKPPTHDWQKYAAPPQTKARKATDRGLRAMARYRKALAAHKIPTVDFTATPSKPAYFTLPPAEESATALPANGGIPPKSVTEDSASYSAGTMGNGGTARSAKVAVEPG
ncbi:MAG: hypothetical protein V4579_09875 [Pseudomonadota bacterium]